MSIGIDLTHVPRFEGKTALANKVLSREEFEHYVKHAHPARFLAGRFAAKEAFLKAWNQLPMPELNTIIIRIGLHGQPYVSYNDESYDLSIAHDGDYAIATVIIMKHV
jgi:phosphopantetheine--protein transferase-like protein